MDYPGMSSRFTQTPHRHEIETIEVVSRVEEECHQMFFALLIPVRVLDCRFPELGR